MRHINLFRLLTAAFVVAAFASTGEAADPSGTWTWKFTTQNGREISSTLILKVDGEKLTGTLARGPQQRTTDISNGTFKNDEVGFDVTVERGDRKVVTKYKGKVEGDTIKGTQQGTRPDGGEGRTRDWEAKRAK
ncbi:MAG: hypothetical protein WD063_18040 [Pirellulales bacterium]